MNEPDQSPRDEIHDLLSALHRRVHKLTVAVMFMAMAVLLLMGAQYGSLVNYYDGDATLFGATSIGAALLGFACGRFARKRA
ncbi:MAG: hypothetical protein HQ582_01720 [Planctomycetes bacterium]|nr:hypothetical protein [Planctomycetota bacterium]